MNNLLQMEVFFFISAIGFIFVLILFIIFLIYLIRSINTFSRILGKIEKDIDHLGESTKELLEEVKHNIIFNLLNFFFKKKKKHKKV